MNLLIVDDQVMVVQGLLKGVDWTQYGIDKAYGAMSVAGALDIFDTTQVDILLCDIEMPIENGLSLVNWVNRKELDTRCILLTAHAKFSYAQQSVKLHVFDYILQPAPYAQIAAVVQRAVEDLKQAREQEYLTSRGETFSQSENTIVGGVLHNWLCCYGNQDEFERYARLGMLPAPEKNCVLAMLQILRWTLLRDWTPALLAVAFENVAGELFGTCGYRVAIAPIDGGDFALLAWAEDESAVRAALEQQMDLLWKVCQKYLGSVVAIYWGEVEQREQLQKKWREIVQRKNDNVLRKSSVFMLGSRVVEVRTPNTKPDEIYLWTQQLTGESPADVERQIVELLDTMSEENQINAQTLRTIHQDFLQAFYNALGANNESWYDALKDPDTFTAYCEAPTSVEQMKKFVHIAVQHFAAHEIPPEKELLQRLNAYIDGHMETEISRQELAGSVFLNADYLNRLVRRATGNSLKEYVARRKMEHAKVLLLTTRLPVAIVASKVGYINAAHFSVAYKKQFGKTPMQTRSGVAE